MIFDNIGNNNNKILIKLNFLLMVEEKRSFLEKRKS